MPFPDFPYQWSNRACRLLGLASSTEHNAFDFHLFYGAVCFFVLLSIPFIYIFNLKIYPKYNVRLTVIYCMFHLYEMSEEVALWRQVGEWLPGAGGGNRE